MFYASFLVKFGVQVWWKLSEMAQLPRYTECQSFLWNTSDQRAFGGTWIHQKGDNHPFQPMTRQLEWIYHWQHSALYAGTAQGTESAPTCTAEPKEYNIYD